MNRVRNALVKLTSDIKLIYKTQSCLCCNSMITNRTKEYFIHGNFDLYYEQICEEIYHMINTDSIIDISDMYFVLKQIEKY